MKKTRISGKIKYRFEHSSEDSRNVLRMSALQGWKWREKREFLWIRMIMAGMGQLPSTDGIVWKSSPANLAYWYVKGEHIYVVLNIPAIVTEALKDAEILK